MSRIYDNWERLVAAVIRRDQLWQLFHEHSRTPSVCSDSSDLSFSFSSRPDDEVSLHGAERVEVMQNGKLVKELTALYKCQEIQAHTGSIWTIKFSFDGKYLASAGEDCAIHVWQVMEREPKGDFCFDSYGLQEKRRGKSSSSSIMSGKSKSAEKIIVPETLFGLSEKPVCSFEGHLADVQDLSWSKSQQLLSSSMDKTVRFWDLSTKTCLKIFLHFDYVTCIQFNPVDDRYFISGSVDAKIRIWSIPDQRVVDYTDLHEIITATCYTPNGQGALVGSYNGSCHIYNISDNQLEKRSRMILKNRKKITGLQFANGNASQVLMTSADSRIRLIDGTRSTHRFRGFHNTNSQISATLTSNRRHVVSASKDSHVYVWRHDGKSPPNTRKGVNVTQCYESFHCQDVSVAIPWPGLVNSSGQNGVGLSNGFDHSKSPAWGMVIVAAGLRGEISFQNFGLPIRM